VAERTRAGAGGAVVMGSNLAWSLNYFFFFPTFEKFLFFGGLSCRLFNPYVWVLVPAL
jgi:riboflavin transporter FmnP